MLSMLLCYSALIITYEIIEDCKHVVCLVTFSAAEKLHPITLVSLDTI